MAVGMTETTSEVGSTSGQPERRASGRHRVRRVLLVGIAVVIGYVGVTTVQVWRASTWNETGAADAAVVLGAAQYDGRPSDVYRGRLDHAADLYSDGHVDTVVVTGAGATGDRFTEAYSGLTYLRGQGIPEDDLLVVDDGESTWESLAAARRVLADRRLDEVLLVSDPYHSYRLKAIAAELDMSAQVSPTTGDAQVSQFLRESGLVSVGRIIGYRRLANLVG